MRATSHLRKRTMKNTCWTNLDVQDLISICGQENIQMESEVKNQKVEHKISHIEMVTQHTAKS